MYDCIYIHSGMKFLLTIENLNRSSDLRLQDFADHPQWRLRSFFGRKSTYFLIWVSKDPHDSCDHFDTKIMVVGGCCVGWKRKKLIKKLNKLQSTFDVINDVTLMSHISNESQWDKVTARAARALNPWYRFGHWGQQACEQVVVDHMFEQDRLRFHPCETSWTLELDF